MTLKRRLFLLPALAAVALAAPAEAGFDAGDRTLQLGASFVHPQDADIATLSADVALGYFVTQGLELGVLQGLNYAFIDDEEDEWNASTVGFLNYNFGAPDARFVPFVGAFGGAFYDEEDVTGTVGPNLGFKLFFNETTFALTRYRYEWSVDGIDEIDENADEGNHIVTVGIGLKF